MPRKSTPRTAAEFRRLLLRWFRRHGRDLPWRRTRNPYRVLVSEFMLQQTQVTRVEAYYHRFLERYPTVQALARSEPTMVRETWAGLGYYRRAANLHRLAQEVVREICLGCWGSDMAGSSVASEGRDASGALS
jgi:A/G-specific adenine glycosylase